MQPIHSLSFSSSHSKSCQFFFFPLNSPSSNSSQTFLLLASIEIRAPSSPEKATSPLPLPAPLPECQHHLSVSQPLPASQHLLPPPCLTEPSPAPIPSPNPASTLSPSATETPQPTNPAPCFAAAYLPALHTRPTSPPPLPPGSSPTHSLPALPIPVAGHSFPSPHPQPNSLPGPLP